MKNKGFTLVEIIICISLLAIIGVGSAIGINIINKNITKKELKQIENRIFDAANIYLENHKEVRNQYYEKNNGILIPLNVLKDEGYMEFQNIDIDNHYVVSLLGSENEDDKCIDNVKVGSWELEKDKVVFLCSDSDLKKQIKELQDKINDIENKLKNDPNNDIKSKLTSGDGYYIAKGANPNNWVTIEMDTSHKDSDWVWWPTNKWRIVSIADGEIRLIYSQKVPSKNSNNYNTNSKTTIKDYYWDPWADDWQNDIEITEHIFYKFKYYNNGRYLFNNLEYAIYDKDDIWTYADIVDDKVTNNGSKKYILYNRIKDTNIKNNIKEYAYNVDYIDTYTNDTAIVDLSKTRNYKFGVISPNEYQDSFFRGKSYMTDIIKNTVLGYIGGKRIKDDGLKKEYNVYLYAFYSYNMEILISYANHPLIYCSNSNGKCEKDWVSEYRELSGGGYVPVITLNSKVKITGGAGTEDNPYTLGI